MTIGPYIDHVFGGSLSPMYREHHFWTTILVEQSIGWPEDDVLLRYDGEDYFLRGLTNSNGTTTQPNISIRSERGQEDASLERLGNFCSVIGWFKSGYVHPMQHSCSSRPIRIGDLTRVSRVAFSIHKAQFRCNYMPIIRDPEAKAALAFWREGVRRRDDDVALSFLCFFKVLESQFDQSNARIAWIQNELSNLSGPAGDRVSDLRRSGIDVGAYIYKQGRCAAAHATKGENYVHPDRLQDIARIRMDIPIIRELARTYIAGELAIEDQHTVSACRDRTQPLHQYIDGSLYSKIIAGDAIARRSLGWTELRISVRVWPASTYYSGLPVRVLRIDRGKVWISVATSSNLCELRFCFDLLKGRAYIDIDNWASSSPKTRDEAIDYASFQRLRKEILGNGLVELLIPSGQWIECEIVIPMNINIAATFAHIDELVASVEAKSW